MEEVVAVLLCLPLVLPWGSVFHGRHPSRVGLWAGSEDVRICQLQGHKHLEVHTVVLEALGMALVDLLVHAQHAACATGYYSEIETCSTGKESLSP